jgi:hypothetical protein
MSKFIKIKLKEMVKIKKPMKIKMGLEQKIKINKLRVFRTKAATAV